MGDTRDSMKINQWEDSARAHKEHLQGKQVNQNKTEILEPHMNNDFTKEIHTQTQLGKKRSST